MSTRAELQHYALMLRNTDPEAWERFCNTFATYTTEFTVAVIEAGPNEILVKQGQAQVMRLLLRDFKECGVARGKPTPQ